MQTKQNGKPVSKAAFVRTMPKAEPAEIIAAGKEAGLTITAANVHATRFQDNANGHKASAKGKRKKATKKVLKPKTVTVRTAPVNALAVHPNMRKAYGALDAELGSQAKQALSGMSDNFRSMIEIVVREEVRAIMAGALRLS